MPGRRSPAKTQPTLTVFAGPNGSGKTTLTNQFAQQGLIDILVNADQMGARAAALNEPFPPLRALSPRGRVLASFRRHTHGTSCKRHQSPDSA